MNASPSTRSTWFDFDRRDFTCANNPATLVMPQTPAAGRPWLWRGEFFGGFPDVDLALLRLGWHVAYVDAHDTFGSPATMMKWDAFYEVLTRDYSLSRRPVLMGMSRGGLYVYAWAALHPDRVGMIYGDAPVCDVRSWPGGLGRGKGNPRDWELFKTEFGLDEPTARAWDRNPIDVLEPIVRAGVPILHLVGDADEVVPVEENTDVLYQRVTSLGGRMHVIVKPGVGHHPHGLADPTPVVDYILANRIR